jgi:hypothetical protein
MKTVNFPYLAAALGLFLLLIINRGSQLEADGNTALPLLTLLIINECAFFLTIAGIFIGVKQHRSGAQKFNLMSTYTIVTILCTLLSIVFTLLGIQLWPL